MQCGGEDMKCVNVEKCAMVEEEKDVKSSRIDDE